MADASMPTSITAYILLSCSREQSCEQKNLLIESMLVSATKIFEQEISNKTIFECRKSTPTSFFHWRISVDEEQDGTANVDSGCF
jgi:hypothetical protein